VASTGWPCNYYFPFAFSLGGERANSDRIPRNSIWKDGDMHYDFKGLEEYSAAVAAFMASAMINPKDSSPSPMQNEPSSQH
jgi:hypothetical protein